MYYTRYREITVLLASLFLLLTVPRSTAAQESPVVAEGAELTLVSDRFSFTEGPARDSEGNVYFTDQPDNAIWKYGVDGELSLFMKPAGRSNGMYFDHRGNLLTCADQDSELWSIDVEDKEVTVLLEGFNGKRFNGPNDLWVAPDGGIYFTDPYYQRDYWERTEKEIEEERVYYLAPDREQVSVAADGLVKPNGLVGTPDGTTLYVADIGDGKTYSYSIGPDGRLTDRTPVAGMGSDGMTIDSRGNIYLTGDGVSVFDKNGKKIEHIRVPQKWTANVTFGGPGKQTLFITASTAVYTLEMKVEGR